MNFHYHCHAVKFRDISIGRSLLFENSFSYLVVVELWRKSQLCSEIMGRGYVREGWSCSWSQANNCGTKKVLKLYKSSKPMKCKCFWFRKRKRGYSPSSQSLLEPCNGVEKIPPDTQFLSSHYCWSAVYYPGGVLATMLWMGAHWSSC